MSQSKPRVKLKAVTPRYSRWIRKYTEVLNDSKVCNLTDAQYRVWDYLLLIAGTAPDGALPQIDVIAFLIRKSHRDTSRAVDELIDLGLIDLVPSGDGRGPVLKPHNWDARQFTSDTSIMRMRRLREKRKKKGVTGRNKTRDVTGDGICSESVSSVSQDTVRECQENASQGMVDLDAERSGPLAGTACGTVNGLGSGAGGRATSAARRGGGS